MESILTSVVAERHRLDVFLTLTALLAPNMELRFWRTKRGEEVDFVLIVNRQPFPIEVKTAWRQAAPPPGLQAFCRRYPRTAATFTIASQPRDPTAGRPTTHHFLGFEEVSTIIDLVRQDG
jgi:hypothetical protein